MSLINPNKKYDKLITFGCSFTEGWLYRDQGTWGDFLSQNLQCEHVNKGGGSSSNYSILNTVMRYCETENVENICVGVQWSEWSRRELWVESQKRYFTFNLATVTDINFNSDQNPELVKFKDNIDIFLPMWFDNQENILRTIHSIILLKNYLKSKNIDFIMFEGLGSILDEYYPSSNHNINDESILLKDKFKLKLFEDIEFFKKYGDMRTYMRKSDLVTDSEFGHPPPKYAKWWADEIYIYLKENYENNSNR
jgi:hypothetical protein